MSAVPIHFFIVTLICLLVRIRPLFIFFQQHKNPTNWKNGFFVDGRFLGNGLKLKAHIKCAASGICSENHLIVEFLLAL